MPKYVLLSLIFTFALSTTYSTAAPRDNKTLSLIASGDHELAIKHCAKARQFYLTALDRDNNNVQILLKIAEAEKELGDLDQALKRARTATQIDPQNIEAHFQLGNYLKANRDLKAAALQYERVLDLSDSKNDTLGIRESLLQLLIDLDDLERADNFSKRWLKGNDKNAACHFYRGLVLSLSSKSNNLQAANKELSKCLALNPAYNKAHYQLALLLLKLDDKERAKTELQTFIQNGASKAEIEQAQAQMKELK